MFQEVIVCLDGSSLAEKILPLARSVADAMRARFTILNVVADANDLSGAESSMREPTRLFGGRIKFLISPDPASAIIQELEKNPRAIPAMTTHGRTALAEALLGSVALKVIRGAKRPVLLYHPQAGALEVPAKITTLVVALNGTEFSEKIIRFAVPMAQSLKAKLTLVQALTPTQQFHVMVDETRGDIQESSYLYSRAAEIKRKHGIKPDWEVLHGDPGDAIRRYVNGMKDAMVAMTTHARGGLARVFPGSVAAECIRKAGVPILIYWPEP